jgi:hypothetical protein
MLHLALEAALMLVAVDDLHIISSDAGQDLLTTWVHFMHSMPMGQNGARVKECRPYAAKVCPGAQAECGKLHLGEKLQTGPNKFIQRAGPNWVAAPAAHLPSNGPITCREPWCCSWDILTSI